MNTMNSQNPNNPTTITQPNFATSDPVDNKERLLVRGTVTGFVQGIAATVGLFTAGLLGALASWGTIRGVQGKWTPWFVLGVPAVVIINIINVVALTAITAPFNSDNHPSDTSSTSRIEYQIAQR